MIEITPLGVQIVDILEKYWPKFLDVAFTRELEEVMTDIELEKGETAGRQRSNRPKPVTDELRVHVKEVGEPLASMIRQLHRLHCLLDARNADAS